MLYFKMKLCTVNTLIMFTLFMTTIQISTFKHLTANDGQKPTYPIIEGAALSRCDRDSANYAPAETAQAELESVPPSPTSSIVPLALLVDDSHFILPRPGGWTIEQDDGIPSPSWLVEADFPNKDKPTPSYIPAPGDAWWVEAEGTTVPPDAVVGGHDDDGEPLYVIRAEHGRSLIPGKLGSKGAFIPLDNMEYRKEQYQVLVRSAEAPGNYRWIHHDFGRFMLEGVYPGGIAKDGRPLYIARIEHLNSLIPGKLHNGICYISYRGKEISWDKHYEILRYTDW